MNPSWLPHGWASRHVEGQHTSLMMRGAAHMQAMHAASPSLPLHASTTSSHLSLEQSSLRPPPLCLPGRRTAAAATKPHASNCLAESVPMTARFRPFHAWLPPQRPNSPTAAAGTLPSPVCSSTSPPTLTAPRSPLTATLPHSSGAPEPCAAAESASASRQRYSAEAPCASGVWEEAVSMPEGAEEALPLPALILLRWLSTRREARGRKQSP